MSDEESISESESEESIGAEEELKFEVIIKVHYNNGKTSVYSHYICQAESEHEFTVTEEAISCLLAEGEPEIKLLSE